MPSRSAKPAPPPSRAEILSDIQAQALAAWAEAAPKPKIEPRPGVDYTKDSYATAFGVSPARAQSLLKALTEGPNAQFERGLYRVGGGQRQAQWVYWPTLAGRPG